MPKEAVSEAKWIRVIIVTNTPENDHDRNWRDLTDAVLSASLQSFGKNDHELVIAVLKELSRNKQLLQESKLSRLVKDTGPEDWQQYSYWRNECGCVNKSYEKKRK